MSPIGKAKAELWQDSWSNLFACIHAKGTVINAKGNFWASIQYLEDQLGWEPGKEAPPREGTKTTKTDESRDPKVSSMASGNTR